MVMIHQRTFIMFLLHKTLNVVQHKMDNNIDDGNIKSYERINAFLWDRSHIKHSIMTIPYNVGLRNMKKYVTDNFVKESYDVDNKVIWYKDEVSGKLINSVDINIFVKIMHDIIFNDL